MSRSLLTLIVLTAVALSLVGCPKRVAPVTPVAPGTAPGGVAPVVPGAPGTPADPGEPVAPSRVNPAKPSFEHAPPLTAEAKADLATIGALRKKLTSYEATMKGDPRGDKVWQVKLKDGNPVKLRLANQAGYLLVVTAEETGYLVDTKRNTASKMDWKENSPAHFVDRFFDPEALAANRPEITEGKADSGVDCWILKWVDPTGTGMMVWIDKEYGLPRQTKSTKGNRTYTYSKLNSVPASTFELPKGVTVREARTRPGGPAGAGGGQ